MPDEIPVVKQELEEGGGGEMLGLEEDLLVGLWVVEKLEGDDVWPPSSLVTLLDHTKIFSNPRIVSA